MCALRIQRNGTGVHPVTHGAYYPPLLMMVQHKAIQTMNSAVLQHVSCECACHRLVSGMPHSRACCAYPNDNTTDMNVVVGQHDSSKRIVLCHKHIQRRYPWHGGYPTTVSPKVSVTALARCETVTDNPSLYPPLYHEPLTSTFTSDITVQQTR